MTEPVARETWIAPAKVNLWLAILGRRDDGYHEIDTGLQAIDLADTLSLEPAPAGLELDCKVDGDWRNVVPAGEENLAARAARLLAARTGHALRLSLTIDKAIPPGAGLGGGSSDAAAVLVALARRFAVPDPGHTLHALAAELGADVPFFLAGGTQRARGIGDRLEPIDPPGERWGVLVWPGVFIDTAWAYHAWDEMRANGTGASPVRPGRNDFESIVFDHYPAVRRAADVLASSAAAAVTLSGSGGAVYALYGDRAARDTEHDRVRGEVSAISPEGRTWAFTTIDHGVRPAEGRPRRASSFR
ncbi:MAG: 4-(cytidine 5'-diphospho)-2-C-methyl-D-erythritol kinase [Gemmatimonadota bacterium]